MNFFDIQNVTGNCSSFFDLLCFCVGLRLSDCVPSIQSSFSFLFSSPFPLFLKFENTEKNRGNGLDMRDVIRISHHF